MTVKLSFHKILLLLKDLSKILKEVPKSHLDYLYLQHSRIIFKNTFPRNDIEEKNLLKCGSSQVSLRLNWDTTIFTQLIWPRQQSSFQLLIKLVKQWFSTKWLYVVSTLPLKLGSWNFNLDILNQSKVKFWMYWANLININWPLAVPAQY